jgi:hypothetical protein
MSYWKSLPGRITVFCSNHYLGLFGLSVLLLAALTFHKVFPIVIDPVIVKAKTSDEIVAYKYHYTGHGMMNRGQRSTTDVTARLIVFEYEGKRYTIVGGLDELEGEGIDTRVIFNRSTPQNAAEYTFIGLIDFPVLRLAFLIWIFFGAILYATATSDRHFSLFNFDIKKPTIRQTMAIAFILLLLPFIKHGKALILGKTTKGLITDEVIFADDRSMHRAIVYQVNDKEYKFAAEGNYNDGDYMIGRTIPIRYDVTKPQNVCICDFNIIYDNNWLVATGMGLIFLSGWFFATRIPNDEGTMDE